jgi:hypothetical protein
MTQRVDGYSTLSTRSGEIGVNAASCPRLRPRPRWASTHPSVLKRALRRRCNHTRMGNSKASSAKPPTERKRSCAQGSCASVASVHGLGSGDGHSGPIAIIAEDGTCGAAPRGVMITTSSRLWMVWEASNTPTAIRKSSSSHHLPSVYSTAPVRRKPYEHGAGSAKRTRPMRGAIPVQRRTAGAEVVGHRQREALSRSRHRQRHPSDPPPRQTTVAAAGRAAGVHR